MASVFDGDIEQCEFARIYNRLFVKIKEGIRSTYGSGPPDPEDVAQAAFEKLGSRMRVADIRDPEGYVWIAARNILLSEKRAESVRRNNSEEVIRRLFPDTFVALDPERISAATEQLAQVVDTLAKMPERRREIFLLTRVHGLTLKEAGGHFGISKAAAIRHVALATQTLTKALETDLSATVDQAVGE